MKFARPFKNILLVLLASALAACGGGGGSDGDNPFTPPGIQMTATASPTSIGINSSTDITVRVVRDGGAAIADGTQVQASVSPAGIGNVSSLGGGATAQTSGGNATFRFQSAATTGTATLSFSAQDPTAAGRTASTTLNITISGASTGDSRLVLTPVRTTLPVNAFNVSPFLGSPYLSEVTINARTASGQAINAPDGVQVSMNPIGATGGFTTLDDPTTTDDPATPEIERNEFLDRLGQGPVDVVAGKATIFVHSLNFSGSTTLTVTMQDPETGQTVTSTLVFTINAITPPLPSNVQIFPLGGPIYVQNSGGNTSGQIEVVVTDAVGQTVPDPVSGNNAFNNVRLELIGEINGERLSGINAQGTNASGTAINIRTTAGVGGAIFTSGTRVGTILVRATSDRADNNVDNGISDPVVGDRAIVVSDGRLFNIELTQPVQNALSVNGGIEVDDDGFPLSPDGTYSLTVAIIATDRLGNPVIPGTVIKFGLIDDPQLTGAGDFQLAGVDGNPQEAGTLFTAPAGAFRTAGGGAGPGDALVIFGKAVTGNRDHESARVVSTVNSQTSLTVQRRFNRNDDTGAVVDSGPVLPYVIGRAVSGNIVAEGITDVLGVARTRMNYPVSRLGRRVVVWAQGEGDIINGSPETVTDAALLAFAGVGPLTVIANPTSIPANTTSPVSVCVIDALGSPMVGVSISFSFAGLSGTGSVDGTPNTGTLDSPTGADGCAPASVTTAGVGQDGGEVVFSVGDQSDSIEIVRGDLVLQARPSVIVTSSQLVTLTLLNSGGVPQAGYQIVGECSGTNGTIVALSEGPGVTNAQGVTTVRVTSTNLDQINAAGGGTCTFRTVDGTAEATVDIIGRDICDTVFSPLPEGCTPPVTVAVTLNLVDGVSTTGFAVSSQPAGIACSVAQGGTQTCTGNFEQGVTVAFTTLPADGTGPQVNWTGGCVPATPPGSNPARQGTLTVTGAVSCTATSP